eukprot:2862537-Rhodomonas_salina.1
MAHGVGRHGLWLMVSQAWFMAHGVAGCGPAAEPSLSGSLRVQLTISSACTCLPSRDTHTNARAAGRSAQCLRAEHDHVTAHLLGSNESKGQNSEGGRKE